MTQLWKADVYDQQFRDSGLGYYVQAGEPQTVGGTPMVRLHGGVLVPAAGWHADRASAVRDAASRIEELGRLLLAQADALRQENGNAVQPQV